MQSQTKPVGAGEMAQMSRAFLAIAEDWVQFLAPRWWFVTICEPDTLYTHSYTLTLNK